MQGWIGTSVAVGSLALLLAAPVVAQMSDFGGQEDVDYASALWSAMQEKGVAGVTGDNVVRGFPYEGTEPHGVVLDTLYLDATVEDRQGALIVKRNFGPQGVTVEQVLNNPGEHLDSITVMFKREEGYAPESGDWFWAKFLPDGTLDETEAGTPMGGKVGGCISCHSDASGGDMMFTTDTLL